MPIKVVAFITVKPGADEAFAVAARTLVAGSRAEPGVLAYDLWREQQGDRRFVFNELYVDQAAVEAHMASTHFKAMGEASRDLAAAAPVIVICDAVDVAT
jgi:quinol monooxygenase YgiN